MTHEPTPKYLPVELMFLKELEKKHRDAYRGTDGIWRDDKLQFAECDTFALVGQSVAFGKRLTTGVIYTSVSHDEPIAAFMDHLTCSQKARAVILKSFR